MDIYKHFCKVCKSEQPHRIFIIYRSKGVKLVCLFCGRHTSRYYNVNKLKEMDIGKLM